MPYLLVFLKFNYFFSGCVTSAEVVLINQQNYEKLLSKLKNKSDDTIVVVSISTQSRASIAANLGWSTVETFSRLSSCLKSIGVKYVLDISSAGDIALIEARNDFCER